MNFRADLRLPSRLKIDAFTQATYDYRERGLRTTITDLDRLTSRVGDVAIEKLMRGASADWGGRPYFEKARVHWSFNSK